MGNLASGDGEISAVRKSRESEFPPTEEGEVTARGAAPKSRELEFPPTEDSIRSRAYKAFPQESSVVPKMGNLKLYLTFVRKYWIIRVASWSEVKPTPS